MKDRIKEVRTALGLTQVEFADALHLSVTFISYLEGGKKQPSARTIDDVCRIFNVNEEWLRTGKGDMFMPQTRNDEISDFLGDLLSDKPDFRHRLISALASMSADEWALVERKVREICEKPDP